jgi:hypothetical protein
MYSITGENYVIDDVLPTLDLDPAAEVRIDIEETGVKLFIGPRSTNGREAAPMFAQ